MVRRLYVEKRPQYAVQAAELLADLRDQVGISRLRGVRVLNRYDIEFPDGLDDATLDVVAPLVFFEPPLDEVGPEPVASEECHVFAVEALPGQFDQRADSAAECVQLITQGERPIVRVARVYVLDGPLTNDDIAAAQRHVLNPVDSRLADLAPVESLRTQYPQPAPVGTVAGFKAMDDAGLRRLVEGLGLALTAADLGVVQQSLDRDPTRAELAVLDAYWSDHCRHTTFSTALDEVRVDDPAVDAQWRWFLDHRVRTEAPTLMEVATFGRRAVELGGGVVRVDESDEINACTVPVVVDDDGVPADWLLLFKNETHNHPTELEPFGGAATCIGGAIRDPLAGRGRVYQAMRVTGAGDPRTPFADTLPGKLPQRRLALTAAAGFSSYGNQVGLATGIVHETYHPGYVAKRLECGAVLAAVPAADVRREAPVPGDVVLLIGGRTGRDGIGGASGSSKTHEASSVAEWGAQVQKGDAPTERKLRRLFDSPSVTRLIKRCNDFGAGGVCVAVGELADGLRVDLDAVPKKYDGLDGTELAVAESQERMAVVVDRADTDTMIALARAENLEATPVAVVTGDQRLVMTWRGQTVVDLPRVLLGAGGAERHASALIGVLPRAVEGGAPADRGFGTLTPPSPWVAPGYLCTVPFQRIGSLTQSPDHPTSAAASSHTRSPDHPASAAVGSLDDQDVGTVHARFIGLLTDINVCGRQGLAERFDSTIGAGTVLMPFGGVRQKTPVQTMVALLPTGGLTTTCSGMADGFNPYWTQRNPYEGALLAVCDSVAKLVAAGFRRRDAYLTLQEYFPALGGDAARWGQPLAALLGALAAQRLLGVAAIGGKDSMSGSFESATGERLDVPPTLVSFAVATGDVRRVVSPEFKRSGVRLIAVGADPVTSPEGFVAALDVVERLTAEGHVESAWVCGAGGLAEGLFLGAIGNNIGVDVGASAAILFEPCPGTVLLGVADGADLGDVPYVEVGRTIEDEALLIDGQRLPLDELERAWEAPLDGVFPRHAPEHDADDVAVPLATPARHPVRHARPTGRRPHPVAWIPVFPGTNCEDDTARALAAAGAEPRLQVINNLTPADVAASAALAADNIRRSQMVVLPGGFSGGDEPDGSAKLIASFLRSEQVAEALTGLLDDRDGLILGICNGFQALIKLGLVPFGRILPAEASFPTLTYNAIGRHQSMLVRTRVASVLSPWLANCEVGDVHTIAVSHGEGRFVVDPAQYDALVVGGQIATQYVGPDGTPTMRTPWNPNGSYGAVEALSSPDGRVLGKMGHSERAGQHLYRNVAPSAHQPIFEAGVAYFA